MTGLLQVYNLLHYVSILVEGIQEITLPLSFHPLQSNTSSGKDTHKATVIRMDCQNIRDQMSTFLEHSPDVHTS